MNKHMGVLQISYNSEDNTYLAENFNCLFSYNWYGRLEQRKKK